MRQREVWWGQRRITQSNERAYHFREKECNLHFVLANHQTRSDHEFLKNCCTATTSNIRLLVPLKSAVRAACASTLPICFPNYLCAAEVQHRLNITLAISVTNVGIVVVLSSELCCEQLTQIIWPNLQCCICNSLSFESSQAPHLYHTDSFVKKYLYTTSPRPRFGREAWLKRLLWTMA